MSDPLSAGITAGANLIGGFLSNRANSRNVDKTNQTNKEIAQMNNQYNEKMLERQIAYNQQSWEQENEYNTATNQRKRLEDAGLNPYMMMNAGNAGTAGSRAGINTPSASQYTAQAAHFDGSFMGQAAESAVQALQYAKDYTLRDKLNEIEVAKGAEEVKSMQLGNQYQEQLILNDIALGSQQIIGQKHSNWKQAFENQNAPKLMKQQIAANDLENTYKSDMNTLNQINIGMRETELKYLPQQLQADLQMSFLQLANQGQLNQKTAMDVVSATYDALGKKVNFRVLSKTANILVKQANANLRKTELEGSVSKEIGNTIGAVGGALGLLSAVGGFKGLKKMPKVKSFFKRNP